MSPELGKTGSRGIQIRKTSQKNAPKLGKARSQGIQIRKTSQKNAPELGKAEHQGIQIRKTSQKDAPELGKAGSQGIQIRKTSQKNAPKLGKARSQGIQIRKTSQKNAPELGKAERQGVKKEYIYMEVNFIVQLKECLSSRKKYLENIIEMLDTKLSKNTIFESVYAKNHKNGFQYYINTDEGRKYIKASEKKQVQQMVQYEYECKVLKAAKEEYKKLNALIKVCVSDSVEDTYEHIPKGKKVLINPIMLTDEEYIKVWNDRKYEKLAFREGAPEYYSSKGERMRSKSEVLIANLLDKMNIYYKYEKPLELNKLGIVHPDFTLLNVKNRKEIYLEHLGMMDDQVYRNNAINKLRDYERSGYYLGDRLLITMETVNCPIDIKALEQRINFVMSERIC